MFRLQRSDRLALGVIILAGALGVGLAGGTRDAVRGAAPSTAVEPAPSSPGVPTVVRGPAIPLELGPTTAGFSVTGVYAGWLSLEEGGLVFRVPEATIRSRVDLEGEPTLVGVRLALARYAGPRWTTRHESPLFSVDVRLARGAELTLRDVELRIDGIGARDLRGAWPVLVHELRVRTPDLAGRSGPARTFVHGTSHSMDVLRRAVEREGA